jgi:predicted MFS family arabinose efflux permease
VNSNRRIALAGFLATAVAYGPARMGYGLFLPQFREEFGFSIEAAGFIASAAFGCFLLALLLAGMITMRSGPRVPLIAGGVAAAIGMGVVSLATTISLLAVGIVLAASSAGFSWVPYNNAAKRAVSKHLHGRVLSIISTGTTFGVAAAALLAFLIVVYGNSWRLTWGLFAGCGLAAAVVNGLALRNIDGNAVEGKGVRKTETLVLRDLLDLKALPLFGLALSFGATASVYLSFAVDRVVQSGGLPGIPSEAAGPTLFAAYGAAGIIGLFTGELESKLGLVRLLRIIFLCSALSLSLIAIAPGSWPGVLISSSLQGACIMTFSAVIAFWSLRIFPFLPTVSFTAVLLFLAAGNMLGPALASLLSDRIGMALAFLTCGGLSLITALAVPHSAAGCSHGGAEAKQTPGSHR